MHVLKHNPVTFFVSHIKLGVGNNILTLTKSDGVQMFDGVHFFFLTQRFDILNWVGTCRKDKEHGSNRR